LLAKIYADGGELDSSAVVRKLMKEGLGRIWVAVGLRLRTLSMFLLLIM